MIFTNFLRDFEQEYFAIVAENFRHGWQKSILGVQSNFGGTFFLCVFPNFHRKIVVFLTIFLRRVSESFSRSLWFFNFLFHT